MECTVDVKIGSDPNVCTNDINFDHGTYFCDPLCLYRSVFYLFVQDSRESVGFFYLLTSRGLAAHLLSDFLKKMAGNHWVFSCW